MKKFYKEASSKKSEDGYTILLDNKPVKTPLGRELSSPTQPLADLMCKEWEEQVEDIVPDSMPINQIITTALDRVANDREEIARQVLAYLDTDMICYRADQPENYAIRQKEAWDTWINWFDELTGEKLETTTALIAIKQSSNNNQFVSNYIKGLALYKFTVFQLLVSITGSIILSMAFMHRKLDTTELFNLSHVEDLLRSEIYNEDFYGTDPIQERKWNVTKKDFTAIDQILKNL